MIGPAPRTARGIALADDEFAATLKNRSGTTGTNAFAWTAIRRIRAVNRDLTACERP